MKIKTNKHPRTRRDKYKKIIVAEEGEDDLNKQIILTTTTSISIRWVLLIMYIVYVCMTFDEEVGKKRALNAQLDVADIVFV